MSLIKQIKEWTKQIKEGIDGKETDAVQEVEKNATPQLESSLEALKKRLLQEIEKTMRDQIFYAPNSVVYVPQRFRVFLNTPEDAQLRGETRQQMAAALGEYALERARALSKNAKITAQAIRIELRVDGTLEKGELRAEAVSEDSGPATVRASPPVKPSPQPVPPAPVPVTPKPAPPPPVLDDGTIVDDRTIKDTSQAAQILYRLEVWQGGAKVQEVPVLRRTLTIGRESPNKSANVRLKTDDRHVSRLHCELTCEAEGRLWVAVLGQNTIVADGAALGSGEKKELPRGAEIELYGFVLRPVFA